MNNQELRIRIMELEEKLKNMSEEEIWIYGYDDYKREMRELDQLKILFNELYPSSKE